MKPKTEMHKELNENFSKKVLDECLSLNPKAIHKEDLKLRSFMSRKIKTEEKKT